MQNTSPHDTNDPMVYIGIDLRLPSEQAERFAQLLTGNDDDILLLAETAMREAMGRTMRQELELSFDEGGGSVERFLLDEGAINRQRERTYGPVI